MAGSLLGNPRWKYVRWYLMAQLVDLLTTLVAILFLGSSEINQFMLSIGLNGSIFIKLFGLSLSAYVLLLFFSRFETWVYIVMIVGSALFPVWNLLNIVVELVQRSLK